MGFVCVTSDFSDVSIEQNVTFCGLNVTSDFSDFSIEQNIAVYVLFFLFCVLPENLPFSDFFPQVFFQLRLMCDRNSDFGLCNLTHCFAVILTRSRARSTFLWTLGNLFWLLSRHGNSNGSGMSHVTTASPNHPSGYLGGWARPWSAEEMLDGQHQRVDIPVHARSAHNGLLQKRLEEDLC